MARPVNPKREGVLKFQDMNFEREMQKALKVIFQNIHALDENRSEISGSVHDPALKMNRRQPRRRSASLPDQSGSHFSISLGQGNIRTKKISV